MLHRHTRPAIVPSAAGFEPPPDTIDIGLPQILAFLRRQRTPIIVSILLFLLAGCAYLVVTPAMYTAQTALLIDTRRLSIFTDGNVFEDSTLTTAAVETQVQLLRSGRMAEAVVRQLGPAAQDPDLLAGSSSPLSIVKGAVSRLVSIFFERAPGPVATDGVDAQPSVPAAAQQAATARAAGAILAGLSVTRTGLSYVITVSFVARNPDLAARVANAITAAYLEDQMSAQFATALRATNWLQARTEELRKQISDPALSIQERNAVRATYESYLQRYTQSVQQQSLPVTEARVITAATPGKQTSPKTLIVIIGSAVMGAAVGLGLAMMRDLLDRTIRTSEQAELVTGAPSLGLLPKFDLSGRAMRRLAKRTRNRADATARKFSVGAAHAVVLTSPGSRFAETLRAVKVATERALHGPGGVLGVVSSLPNEGRSTVAINLARLVAQSGGRILLIDGDFRNSALSAALVPQGTIGIVQAATGSADVGGMIWTDPVTPLHFLPSGSDKGSAISQDILASSGLADIIQLLRQHYDLIVVDLPSIVPVVDVQAAAHLFDALVFVVEWGFVTQDVLSQAFHKPGVAEKVVGVVLNKVDASKARRFENAPFQTI